jgi:hypothetical protein
MFLLNIAIAPNYRLLHSKRFCSYFSDVYFMVALISGLQTIKLKKIIGKELERSGHDLAVIGSRLLPEKTEYK